MLCPLKQEAMIGHCYSNSSLNKYCLDLFLEENLLLSCHLLSLFPQIQFLHPLTQPNNNLSFEGSSSSSNPSNEASSFVSYASQFPQHGHMKLSIGKSSASRKTFWSNEQVFQIAKRKFWNLSWVGKRWLQIKESCHRKEQEDQD
jgi:hypothetical protein